MSDLRSRLRLLGVDLMHPMIAERLCGAATRALTPLDAAAEERRGTNPLLAGINTRSGVLAPREFRSLMHHEANTILTQQVHHLGLRFGAPERNTSRETNWADCTPYPVLFAGVTSVPLQATRRLEIFSTKNRQSIWIIGRVGGRRLVGKGMS